MTTPTSACPLRLTAHVYLAASLLFFCSAARANGRPPAVTGFATAEAAVSSGAKISSPLVAGLTFGAAVSIDGGKSFQWVCEEALGGPTSTDAALLVPNANMVVVGGLFGVHQSHDGGCTWNNVEALAGKQVEAIVRHPTDAATWFVAANDTKAGEGGLWRTADTGATYTKLDSAKTPGLYFYGVDIAASKPDTLAISAGNNGNGNSCYALLSADAGQSWQEVSVAESPAASVEPRITISPTDANHMIITVLDATTNGTRILSSKDGGQNFMQVGTLLEAARNTRFSADGQHVFVAGTSRLLRSNDGGTTFTQLKVPTGNACAARYGDLLYACGDAKVDGFSLAQSRDWGASWDKTFNLADLQGPFRCKSGTTAHDICLAQWTNQATVIGASSSVQADEPAIKHDSGCHCATVGRSSWHGSDSAMAGICVLLAGWRLRRGTKQRRGAQSSL